MTKAPPLPTAIDYCQRASEIIRVPLHEPSPSIPETHYAANFGAENCYVGNSRFGKQGASSEQLSLWDAHNDKS
jgi:hypothetical protein